jgi:hypothetical protein
MHGLAIEMLKKHGTLLLILLFQCLVLFLKWGYFVVSFMVLLNLLNFAG